MKTLWIWVVVMLLLPTYLTSSLLAATVQLTSGKVLEGNITETTDEQIKIDTGIGGAVSFYKEEIATIDGKAWDEYFAQAPGASEAKAITADYETAVRALETDNPLYKKAFELLKTNYGDNNVYADVDINKVLEMDPGWENKEVLLKILKDNESTIAAFHEATQQENNTGALLVKQSKESGPKAPLPRYSPSIQLHNLNLLHAHYSLAQRDYQLAEEDLSASLNYMIQMAQQKPPTLLSGTINKANWDRTTPFIKKCLQNQQLSRTLYEHMLQKLLRLDQEFSITKMWDSEQQWSSGYFRYFADKAKADGTYNQEFWDQFLKKADEVGNLRIEFLKRMVTNDNPDADIKKEYIAWEDELWNSLPEDLRNKDPMSASALSDYENPQFPFAQEVAHADEYAIWLVVGPPAETEGQIGLSNDYLNLLTAENRVLILATALKLYHMDNRSVPESLSDLVPKYIPKIPEDVFNYFQPMKYVRQEDGYRVYSVGPDREDQAGQVPVNLKSYAGGNREEAGDVVFAFEPAQ